MTERSSDENRGAGAQVNTLLECVEQWISERWLSVERSARFGVGWIEHDDPGDMDAGSHPRRVATLEFNP